MKTLETTTDLSMVEIVTLLGADHLNASPNEDKSKARCAPVAFADGHPVLVLDAEQRHADVYNLLDSVKPDPMVNYYAVITAGWASPVDGNECAPSQHPERKRVELLCLASRDGRIASALSMSGNDELITDDGQAQGTLALAVGRIFG